MTNPDLFHSKAASIDEPNAQSLEIYNIQLTTEKRDSGLARLCSVAAFRKKLCERKSRHKWTKLQWLTLMSQSMILFATTLSFSLPVAFFPEEAANKGVQSQAGLILGCFELVMFITSPIYGALLLKVGPNVLCMLGSALSIGSCVTFGFLDDAADGTAFVILCILVRIVSANGCSMLTVYAFSVLIDCFPEEVSWVTGIAEMVSGLGFMVGPFIGAFLYEHGGYWVPFVVTGVLFLIFSVTGYIWQPKLGKQLPNEGNYLKLFRIPGIVVLYIEMMGSSIAMTFLDPLLETWLEEKFGMSNTQGGLVFLVWSGVYTIAAPGVGKLADLGYIYSTMIGGCALSVLAMLLIGPAPFLNSIFGDQKYIGLVYFCFVLLGFGCAGVMIPPYIACLNLAEVSGFRMDMTTYGLISGLTASSFSLGAFIGPTLSGYIGDEIGFEWTTTIFACILLLIGCFIAGFRLAMRVLGRPLSMADVSAKPEAVDEEFTDSAADSAQKYVSLEETL